MIPLYFFDIFITLLFFPLAISYLVSPFSLHLALGVGGGFTCTHRTDLDTPADCCVNQQFMYNMKDNE